MLGMRAHLPAAYAEIFRRHRSTVARAAFRHSRDRALTEDVVQDVFERLIRFPDQFDARRAGLGTFLAMKARTRCIDALRSEASRQQREHRTEAAEAAPAAEDESLARLSGEAVRSLLATLPAAERAALELAFERGMSYRAIATHLDIPEGTAKSRIRIGLRRLRATAASRKV
jgi:RNA polymerase sigma-70 factor (ECF subfamily)